MVLLIGFCSQGNSSFPPRGAASFPLLPKGFSPLTSIVPAEPCGGETALGSSPSPALRGCVALGSRFTSPSLHPLTYGVVLCPYICGLLGRSMSFECNAARQEPLCGPTSQGRFLLIARFQPPRTPATPFRRCFSSCPGCQRPNSLPNPPDLLGWGQGWLSPSARLCSCKSSGHLTLERASLAGFQSHPPDTGQQGGEAARWGRARAWPHAGAGSGPWADRPGERRTDGQPVMGGIYRY